MTGFLADAKGTSTDDRFTDCNGLNIGAGEFIGFWDFSRDDFVDRRNPGSVVFLAEGVTDMVFSLTDFGVAGAALLSCGFLISSDGLFLIPRKTSGPPGFGAPREGELLSEGTKVTHFPIDRVFEAVATESPGNGPSLFPETFLFVTVVLSCPFMSSLGLITGVDGRVFDATEIISSCSTTISISFSL